MTALVLSGPEPQLLLGLAHILYAGALGVFFWPGARTDDADRRDNRALDLLLSGALVAQFTWIRYVPGDVAPLQQWLLFCMAIAPVALGVLLGAHSLAVAEGDRAAVAWLVRALPVAFAASSLIAWWTRSSGVQLYLLTPGLLCLLLFVLDGSRSRGWLLAALAAQFALVQDLALPGGALPLPGIPDPAISAHQLVLWGLIPAAILRDVPWPRAILTTATLWLSAALLYVTP